MEQGVIKIQMGEYEGLNRRSQVTFWKKQFHFHEKREMVLDHICFFGNVFLRVRLVSRVNPCDLAFSERWGLKLSSFMSLSQVCTVSCLLFLENNKNSVLVG